MWVNFTKIAKPMEESDGIFMPYKPETRVNFMKIVKPMHESDKIFCPVMRCLCTL